MHIRGRIQQVTAITPSSKKKLEGIGRTDVNQYQMYLRFICKHEEEIIVPPPKPKGEPT